MAANSTIRRGYALAMWRTSRVWVASWLTCVENIRQNRLTGMYPGGSKVNLGSCKRFRDEEEA
jgi:hypothetical protein